MKTVQVSTGVSIINADMREALAAMEPDSIDAIVCDPPYGLGFMGKGWDHGVPGVEFWAEALRVLKPGGHLLAFGGTRTVHRLAVAIEDAGFEVRDCLSWMYGSGFPKSLNVGKAIDKAVGARRSPCADFAPDSLNPDEADRDICTTCFFREVDHAVGEHEGTVDFGMKNRCAKCDKPFFSGDPCKCPKPAAVTPEAEQWEGWGTALKPAYEPILLARKPMAVGGRKATVAANVLTHGTGALNIDATRIGFASEADERESKDKNRHAEYESGVKPLGNEIYGEFKTPRGELGNYNPPGRWPANVLLTHDEGCVQAGTITERVGGKTDTTTVDFVEGYERGDGWTGGEVESAVWECEPDCPVRLLDEQTGDRPSSGHYNKGTREQGSKEGAASIPIDGRTSSTYADSGGASRFFYSSKTSKKERNAGLPEGRVNNHPTVKPLNVMAWLCRLVTPPGGTVLDPFMGSGSTGVAAVREGFAFVGVDSDTENGYCNIAYHRIKHALAEASS
jgi:DNA modification methylase